MNIKSSYLSNVVHRIVFVKILLGIAFQKLVDRLIRISVIDLVINLTMSKNNFIIFSCNRNNNCKLWFIQVILWYLSRVFQIKELNVASRRFYQISLTNETEDYFQQPLSKSGAARLVFYQQKLVYVNFRSQVKKMSVGKKLVNKVQKYQYEKERKKLIDKPFY